MRHIAIPLLLVLAAGCATFEEGGPAINMLSTQEEVQMGQQMAAQVQEQLQVLDDPVIPNYVRTIGQRLARYAPRQDIPYQFTVIDAPDTVNAFALPGGYLYVFTGLLKVADNEAELAGVMAHEIAHVALQHHGQALTRQYTRNTIQSIILGREPGAAAQMAAGLINQGMGLRFSRANEAQADGLGMQMMAQAGYDPRGMLSFMVKMRQIEAQEGGGPQIPLFMSHPPTDERLANLQAQLAQYPPQVLAQTATNQQAYQQTVRARLAR